MIYLSPSPLSIWIILYTFLLASMEVMAARLPDIYWNATNPMFRIDNTDHIIDVNRGNVAYEYDQINIICPTYSKGTREDEVETYIIYNVSKEEYDSCHIANPAASRTIAVCDKPFLNRYYTITFRPFTPQPGGLEFRPGQDYYFIALSARPGEPNPTRDCQKHHMKVVFKVCCQRSTPQPPIGSKSGVSTSTTLAPSTSTVSSSSASGLPVVTYPGVINNDYPRGLIPSMPPRHPPKVTSTYPTSFPNLPPVLPKVSRPGPGEIASGFHKHASTQKPTIFNYPPYGNYPPRHPGNPGNFNHLAASSTTSSTPPPDLWWKPHPSPKSALPNSRHRIDFSSKYPPTRGRYPPNDFPRGEHPSKSDGLNSSSHRAGPSTWTISCLALLASAILLTSTTSWSQHLPRLR